MTLRSDLAYGWVYYAQGAPRQTNKIKIRLTKKSRKGLTFLEKKSDSK